MNEPQSDEDLYWLWKQTGDASELNRVLLRYARAIIWELTGREHPDLCVDIVRRAFEREPSFQGRSKFMTWFYRLARNATLNYIEERRARKECSIDTLPEEFATPIRPESLDARIELSRLLASLNPTDRQLVLAKLQGLSNQEIAQALGLTRWETVRSRWKRLKLRLREQFEVASRSQKAKRLRIARSSSAMPPNA